MLCDDINMNEADIKIRYNRLVRQFENNNRYISTDSYTIADDEDISYEMLVHNKKYQAVYFQNPEKEKWDTLAIQEKMRTYLGTQKRQLLPLFLDLRLIQFHPVRDCFRKKRIQCAFQSSQFRDLRVLGHRLHLSHVIDLLQFAGKPQHRADHLFPEPCIIQNDHYSAQKKRCEYHDKHLPAEGCHISYRDRHGHPQVRRQQGLRTDAGLQDGRLRGLSG